MCAESALSVVAYLLIGLAVGVVAVRSLVKMDEESGETEDSWTDASPAMKGWVALCIAVTWPLVVVGFALFWISQAIGRTLVR